VNSGPEQMNPTSMANMPNQPSSRPNAQVGSHTPAVGPAVAAPLRCSGARASSTYFMMTFAFELNHPRLKPVHSLGLICLSAHSAISIC
jgi:hypothetical protein